MPNIVIDQTDLAGATDGRFIRNPYSGQTDYAINVPAQIGHIYGGVNEYDIIHWFRFKIPFDYDPYLTFNDVRLYLYWHPDPESSSPRAHEVPGTWPGAMGIGIYSTPGSSAPQPADQAEAYTQWDGSFVWTWENAILRNYPGWNLEVVPSDSFATGLMNRTIRDSSWVAGDVINIFLYLIPDAVIGRNKWWRFRSYSYNEVKGNSHTTSPQLWITYTRGTPGQGNEARHVEHELTVNQDITAILRPVIHEIEHTVTVEQDISLQRVFGRSVQHQLIVEQEFAPVEMEYERDLVHGIVVRQTIEVSHAFNAPEVQSVLNVEQLIEVNVPFRRSLVHDLTIQQDIEVVRVHCKTVEHQLYLQQIVFRPSPIVREILSEIHVQHSIDVELVANRTVEHTLTIEQDISVNMVRTRAVEHELVVTQGFVMYVL